MAAYTRLKNEFTEDEKHHNLMALLILINLSNLGPATERELRADFR